MSGKIKKEWKVTIMFEPSRVEDAHLVQAHEKVLPLIKCQIKSQEVKCFQNSISNKKLKEL